MISTLTISVFRGISQEIPFKFGAVTLLAGRNGLGKTTVFDAIDWCLFGASWRLGFDTESIRNIYHPNMAPVVRMEMRMPDKALLIERTAASAFLNGARISDRDLVETLHVQGDTGAARHGDDVDDGIGRTAERHVHADGVVERGGVENFIRRQVVPHHVDDAAAGGGAHARMIGVRRRDRGRAGQREP